MGPTLKDAFLIDILCSDCIKGEAVGLWVREQLQHLLAAVRDACLATCVPKVSFSYS